MVISDLNMPEMDGFAFVEAVHDEFGRFCVPFVFYTSHRIKSRR